MEHGSLAPAGDIAESDEALGFAPERFGGEARLTEFVTATGLLGLEAASVGLAVWQLFSGNAVVDYVVRNQAPETKFWFLSPSWCAAGPALAAMLVASISVLRGGERALEVARGLAVRLLPLVLSALLPLSLRYQIWINRELPFLLLATLLVFGMRWTLEIALGAPPLAAAAHPRWHAWGRTWQSWVADWRQCARLVPRSLPGILVALGAAAYTAFFVYHTVVHHRNGLSSSLDLGMEDNLVYNALHAAPLFKSSPLGGPDARHLGNHATWFTFLIVPFYALRQNAETLLIVQAVLLGGAAIPLYLLGRRFVTPWTAALVAFCYLLYAPLHGSNLYDFHYLPLGTFFLWFTLYFALRGRWVLTAIFALVSLSVREDVAAALALLGVFLLLTSRRPLAGVALTLLGASYFLIMKFEVMRHALGGQESFVYQYRDLIPPGEHGFGGVLQTIIGNPAFTLASLLERDKFIYLLEIMLPFAFFPLRRPVGLLCCLSGFFFTLLSTKYPPQIQISFQYTAYWVAPLFVAVLANLAWLGREARIGGRTGRAWKWSWIAAIAAGTVITSNQMGAIFQQHTARGGFGPYHFGTNREDLERRESMRKLIAKVPPMAKITAAEDVVPQLSNRPDAYTLRHGLFDAEYLLFTIPTWSSERSSVLEGLQPGTFGVVAEHGSFVLAKRGYSTAANAQVLARIGGGHGE
jgi:uncharacterized membrane protein